MIVKSYEVQKNLSNLLKYNFFLLYGENQGLKKDIRKFIKKVVEQKNSDVEILSLYELDSVQECTSVLRREVDIEVITLGDKGAIIVDKNDVYEISYTQYG